MPRIVLAAALLLLSAEVARANDDFKTGASGAPDYANGLHQSDRGRQARQA